MINKILDYLDELYPNPKCELEYTKDYELLIAIVMSAQTTDKRVNMVNKVLFKKYQSIKELSEASLEDIEKIIKPIGTYKKKAVFIKEIATKLINDNIKVIPNDNFPYDIIPNKKDYKFATSNYRVLFYKYENYVIWGITAKILENFLEFLEV